MSNFDGYVFVDLETTGLDPNTCDILEVGILVVDKRFNTLATFQEVAFFDFDKHRGSIPQVVQEMHHLNGLWDECKNSQRSLRQVELDALSFLEGGEWMNERLSGSTINFDRSFLARHMPQLHEAFHYRNYDVSTLKGLFEKYDWPKPNPAADTEHRALPDCYDSMVYLRGYTQKINQAFNWENWADHHVCDNGDDRF